LIGDVRHPRPVQCHSLADVERKFRQGKCTGFEVLSRPASHVVVMSELGANRHVL